MDQQAAISTVEALRGLPAYALFPAIALVLALIAWQAFRAQNRSAAFLIFAVGLRSALDAMHVFTFQPSPAKLSYNALASVTVVGLGLLVVRRRASLGLLILPMAPLLAVMAASTVHNHGLTNAFTAFTKYGYLIVLAVAANQAADELGTSRLMQLLLPLMLVPLAFQLLAIPLGVTKAGESDGSVSYIGGFHHEAAFSMLIFGALLVVCMADRLRFGVKATLIAWCGIALFLANYRTTILAAAPLIAVTLFVGGVRQFVPEQRRLVGGVIALLGAGAFAALVLAVSTRFADIAEVVKRGSGLIQRPRTFSFEDRHLLSGRVEIWSNYIYAWHDGSAWRHAIGFGPESWVDFMGLYAHNTLVSALYEIGICGVVAMLVLLLGFSAMAFRAPAPVRLRLIAAHLSFLIANMATMPFWMIEGLIYYSILCGITVHYALPRPLRARSRSQAAGGHSPLLFAPA